MSYSRLGRAEMATLTVQICVHRLKKLLGSLKINSQELLWQLLASTIHLGTRNKLTMHPQHDICPNFQSTGLGKMGSVRCAVECFQMENPRTLFSRGSPRYARVFKGMKRILEERDFTDQADLHAECPQFKCVDPMAGCCCQHILFNQPDFQPQNQHSWNLWNHIATLPFFYPKFHCELNFIEQCWGAAKYQYRILSLTLNEAQMEKNVRVCLDGVDLIKMRR